VTTWHSNTLAGPVLDMGLSTGTRHPIIW